VVEGVIKSAYSHRRIKIKTAKGLYFKQRLKHLLTHIKNEDDKPQ
jgi:hypothetical protein